MNLMELAREKGADYLGKTGIVVGASSEVLHQTGMLEQVTIIQIISAFGVLSLIVERMCKGLMASHDKGRGHFIFSAVVWSVVWISLIGLVVYKL